MLSSSSFPHLHLDILFSLLHLITHVCCSTSLPSWGGENFRLMIRLVRAFNIIPDIYHFISSRSWNGMEKKNNVQFFYSLLILFYCYRNWVVVFVIFRKEHSKKHEWQLLKDLREHTMISINIYGWTWFVNGLKVCFWHSEISPLLSRRGNGCRVLYF